MANIESGPQRKVIHLPFVAPVERVIAASDVKGLIDKNGHTNGSSLVREQRVSFDGGPSVADRIKF